MRRRRRRRINIKRLSITLTVLMVILIFTTKVSLKYAAKGNSIKGKLDLEKAPIMDKVEEESSKDLSEKLEKIEKKTESEVQVKVDTEKVEVNEENIGEKKQENPKSPSEYNDIFKTDLFIGDSITDSLSFYGLVDENNVIAKLGFTAKKAQDEISTIINKNPENIYMMFGMNDMLSFRDTEMVTKYYGELIDEIHKKLPDANIYIQSILPVSSEVKTKTPYLTNENIDEFNLALANMAEEKSLEYINTREIIEQDLDLFEPDGIHMKYKFYELWLDYLIDKTK